METNSSKFKTFMVKVWNYKKSEQIFVLKVVNSDNFLPRTFKSFLPGVKSGDIVSFQGKTYTNKDGYEAIFIDSKTIKVV